MPEPGKTMTPAGTMSSMRSLRLKGAALPSRVQSGLKAICVTPRLSAQQAAAFSAPFGVPPWISTMSGMLGEHLVEHGPDALVIGVIDAAGEGDLRAFGQKQLGIGPAAGGDEVPAVDHGGGQVLVVDEAACAGTPGRAGLGFVAFGGEIADLLEGFAALDEVLALGDKAFEFDGAHLGAVLFSWLRFCRSSLSSSWRCTRAAFLWKRSARYQSRSSRSGSSRVS